MLTCATCGRYYDPDDVIGTHPFRHPVNGTIPKQDKDKKESPGSEPTQSLDLPTDPLLRHVLINKGVITTLDLIRAEQELKQSGVVIAYDEPSSRHD